MVSGSCAPKDPTQKRFPERGADTSKAAADTSKAEADTSIEVAETSEPADDTSKTATVISKAAADAERQLRTKRPYPEKVPRAGRS